MSSHDRAYKLLFSHPQMVRDLIVGFVRGTWQAKLALRSLEKCNAHFVADNLRSRTSDIVWRIRAGENDDTYLLLEFQSTVEGLMAVRVLTYIGLLYQDLIKSGRMSRRELQPILPIVLYNGERPWNAPTSLRAISRTSPTFPGVFRPEVRYQLIDVRRMKIDAPSLKHNLAAALFRIENSRNVRAVCEHARSLYAIVERSGTASLRRAFDVWIHRVVLARFKGSSIAKELINLEERHTMLSERIDRWLVELEAKGLRKGRRDGLRQGIREGLRKGQRNGLCKGRREGRADALLDFLNMRFDEELPRWVQCQVRQATSAQLKRWGKRVLTAASLHELFGRRRKLDAGRARARSSSERLGA